MFGFVRKSTYKQEKAELKNTITNLRLKLEHLDADREKEKQIAHDNNIADSFYSNNSRFNLMKDGTLEIMLTSGCVQKHIIAIKELSKEDTELLLALLYCNKEIIEK